MMENLVETAPEDAACPLDGIRTASSTSISHAELRATVRHVLEEIGESFRTAPAATMMHHAYRHGLLEHTVHMARGGTGAPSPLSRGRPRPGDGRASSSTTSGKTIEYEGALAAKRGRRGILHGHVVLGYQLVRKAALKAKLDPERTERLEHVILSHQGKLEWGAATRSPRRPRPSSSPWWTTSTPRWGWSSGRSATRQPGDEFTERILGLDGPAPRSEAAGGRPPP